MGRPAMIGALVKFSAEKRKSYFPVNSAYEMFDGCLGLVVSYTEKDTGCEHVRVRWVKPVEYRGNFTTVSDFNLLNFEVLSASR